MTRFERFAGCILCGAIGDALGSNYENQQIPRPDIFDPFSTKTTPQRPPFQITDDTQLTLATAEAMLEDPALNPETFAKHYLQLYRQKRLNGLGASTLKALRELDMGIHWSQAGRTGEYAAGNGAAMRIAPLAFREDISNTRIREICSITHRNDEAYAGALAVVVAIRLAVTGEWTGKNNLIQLIIPQLPDTRVRDRLIEIENMIDLNAVAALGSDGYVVHSVPLAITAAGKVGELGIENVFQTLIDAGGDTDTNCSIAGQIMGALVGEQGIPQQLSELLKTLPEYRWMRSVLEQMEKERF